MDDDKSGLILEVIHRQIVPVQPGYFELELIPEDNGYTIRQSPVIAWSICTQTNEIEPVTLDGPVCFPESARAVRCPDGRVIDTAGNHFDDSGAWQDSATQDLNERKKEQGPTNLIRPDFWGPRNG